MQLSANLQWQCPFTIICLCLAILYSLLLFLCLFYSFRLLRLPCRKRQSQRFFLLVCAAQCLCRCLYFYAWPFLIANTNEQQQGGGEGGEGVICTISAEGEHEGWAMMITGSLPSALFLSAFSINVFTFSRVYHNTLLQQQARGKSKIIFILLTIINGLTYTTLILLYAVSFTSDRVSWANTAEVLYLYTLSCSSLLVAASFCLYGVKLWLGVRNKDQAQQQDDLVQHLSSSNSSSSIDHIMINSPRARSRLGTPLLLTPSSSSASLQSLTRAHTHTGQQKQSHHPMRKLAVISVLCFLCFLVRVLLLPILQNYQDGEFSFTQLLLYLCLAEVVPLCLVLYLFDTVRGKKSSSSSTASSASTAATTSLAGQRSRPPLVPDISTGHVHTNADKESSFILPGDSWADRWTDIDIEGEDRENNNHINRVNNYQRETEDDNHGQIDPASPSFPTTLSSSYQPPPTPITHMSYVDESGMQPTRASPSPTPSSSGLSQSHSRSASASASASAGVGPHSASASLSALMSSTTLSPRELDRRAKRAGMSYSEAFKKDLKNILD